MKTPSKKIPVAEWLALKLVADEHGGVGSGRMFEKPSTVTGYPVMALSDELQDENVVPCCLIGIAIDAGVVPEPNKVDGFMPMYRNVRYFTIDTAIAQLRWDHNIPFSNRVPFEMVMEKLGFSPVGA
jgi:hypothetical protein